MSRIDTFCPSCWVSVQAEVQEREEVISVKGVDISVTSQIAVCPDCGAGIGDLRLEEENLQRAYDQYRREKGLIFPQEIRDLREKYGISQKSLGLLLGIGEASIVRYESGCLPSPSNNEILKNACNDKYFRNAFSKNGSRIPEFQQKNVLRAQQKEHNESIEYYVLSCDATTGYRLFDENRLVQCISLLSKKIEQNHVTRILKGLFLADFLNFEKTNVSITGLQYAALPLGPVPDGYKNILSMLAGGNRISISETAFGQKIEAQDAGVVFDQGVLDTIDLVARYINSFPSTSDLSENTHSLMIWRQRETGQKIIYQAFNGVKELIEARLGESVQ